MTYGAIAVLRMVDVMRAVLTEPMTVIPRKLTRTPTLL